MRNLSHFYFKFSFPRKKSLEECYLYFLLFAFKIANKDTAVDSFHSHKGRCLYIYCSRSLQFKPDKEDPCSDVYLKLFDADLNWCIVLLSGPFIIYFFEISLQKVYMGAWRIHITVKVADFQNMWITNQLE